MKRYNAYKPSGIEWIGDIPEKWDIKPFKYCMTINNGADYKNIEDSDGYPVFGSGGSFAFAKKYMYDGEVVFLGRKGTVDKPLYYNGKFWAIDTMFYAIPQKNVSCKYMYYQALTFPFDYYLTDTARPSMTQTDLGDNKIAVPPKDEQVAIASYLDAKCAKIDNVLSVQQKRIELLKELKQSIITNAVTKGLDKNVELKPSGIEWIGDIPEKWKLMKLKYICKDEKYSIKTGPFGSQLKGEDLREEGDVRVYNQRNVINDCFDDVQFYVTSAKAKDLQSFFTKENDLLVTSRGTIGKCSLLPKTASMGVLHPCLIALRINEKKCSLQWAKFFINESDCFKTNVFLNSNATTIEVIYTDTLKSIFIPLPPLKEQLSIISYLEHRCSAIDSQISKIEHQIELLKEYKQSIITECVTGKRKVC